MGFDFGAFAGAMGTTALDTYTKLKDQQRLRDEHEFQKDQRARLKALQDQLSAGPKPGDPNYGAEQKDGIPLADFQKQYGGALPTDFDPAKVQAGQEIVLGGQLPPAALPQGAVPAPASTGAPADAPAALPQGGLPQTTAPQQKYYTYADPKSGQVYATANPARYSPEDVAMHQADMMVASGLPEYISQGTQMRNSIVQNKLVRQQVQEGEYRIAAAEAQRAVSQAGIFFQQGDMENGIKTLSAAYNTYVPGPYKMQAQPVQGQPDMLQVVHTDADGKPILVEKPRSWKTLIAEASAIATPGGFAGYLNEALQREQQQAELTARSKVWNLQADQIQAALDAGAPAAEVEKMKAEAAAAQEAGGASKAYREAQAADLKERRELSAQVRGLNAEILKEKDPNRLALLISQRAAIEGKVQNTTFYQTLNGDLVRHSPASNRTELFSPELKMFLPLGIDGRYVAGLPEVKNGNVQFVTTPDGQVGYRSKNMSPTQMATTYEEAVEFMKRDQTPASALPAD